MHLVLVIEPGPAQWSVSSPSHEGAPRVIDNPLAGDDLVTRLKVLREQASRPIDPDTPHGQVAERVLVANAGALGESLTQMLLSDAQRALLRDAIGTPELTRARLTVRVRITQDPAEDPASAARRADSVLALPWELVTPTPGEFAVRAARLDVVREALVPGAVGLTLPERTLSVAVLVAAPDGQSALRHEEESWRLMCALHGHDVDFADLGGRDDLLAMLGREVTPTVMHFSGHGLPGALVFEDPYGDAQVVDVAKLTDAMRSVRTRPDAIREMPRLFYLASCHGSGGAPAEPAAPQAQPATRESKLFDEAALGRGPSTAAALHRCGFAQVVAYHGPVGDALSTRAEEAFYRALSKGETSLQAVADARRAMCDDVAGEGKARVRHPIAWAQLALYHRGDVHPLALASREGERAAVRFRRREAKVKVQGLPVLEVGFIGRRKHLHEVRRMVERKGRRLVVIQGLGGLGKTALASRLLETVLAHERVDALVVVCKKGELNPAGAMLLAAEEHGRLHGLAGWEATCKTLGERYTDTVERFEATVRALRELRPKLVVYADNAESWQRGPAGDDPDALGEWLPEAEPWWAAMERLTDDGVVMLSTRYRWPGLDPESIVAIGAMTPADSLKLIETWDRLGDLPSSVQQKLSTVVDGHPRTVEFLNELVKRRQADQGRKLEEYENLWADLIEPVLPAGRKRVSANLLLDDLWKALSNEARAHASVLRVLRVAAPDDVIRAVGSADGSSTGALRKSGLLTRTTVQIGTDERRVEQDRWSMHPLVVEHVRAHGAVVDEVAAHLAVGRAYAARAQREGALWTDNDEAVHHLHAGKEPNEAWPLARLLILTLRDAALYKLADERLEACAKAGTSGNAKAVMLTLWAQTKAYLGDRTKAVLDLLDEAEKCATEENTRGVILHERGSQLQQQGRFAEAEAELRRSLAIDKATVGENHPSYATSLHALANALRAQGRFAEAEAELRRALAILKATVGENHPDYAASLHVLAMALQAQGRFADAEAELRRVLAIKKATVGENHPDYAASLHALANALQAQGRFAEAEAELRRSLTIKKATVGENHPDYAASLHALAMALQAQGRFAEAEAELRRALTIKKATVGENHPDYAASLHALANALQAQGRFAEAEAELRRALAILKATVGENHPSYATSLHELAGVLQAQGRFAEAEAELRRSLAIDKATVGENHPDYATSLHALAMALQAQGRFAEAEAELRRALTIKKATVGENHPDYAASLINLCVIVAEQGRAAEGVSLAERALAIMIQTHGEVHPSVAQVLNLQAQLLASLGRPEAAEVARRALAMLERTLGANHPTTQEVRPVLRAILDGTPRQAASPEEQAVLTPLNEAHAAMRAQRFSDALTSFQQALAAARAQSNDRGTVAALLGLAQALALTGAHDDALTTAREAEAVAARTQDATALRQARQLVALLARGPSSVRASTVDYNARLQAIDAQARAGDVADARKALTELAAQAAADGTIVAEASARGRLAQMLAAEGDAEGATREAERALAIAEELGQDDAAAHFRALLAKIDAGRGKASPAELVRRLSVIAQRLARKEYNEAFTEVQSVLDAARDAGHRPAEFSARMALSQIQAAVGLKELALVEARKALDIARELRNAEAIAHVQTWIDALT